MTNNEIILKAAEELAKKWNYQNKGITHKIGRWRLEPNVSNL